MTDIFLSERKYIAEPHSFYPPSALQEGIFVTGEITSISEPTIEIYIKEHNRNAMALLDEFHKKGHCHARVKQKHIFRVSLIDENGNIELTKRNIRPVEITAKEEELAEHRIIDAILSNVCMQIHGNKTAVYLHKMYSILIWPGEGGGEASLLSRRCMLKYWADKNTNLLEDVGFSKEEISAGEIYSDKIKAELIALSPPIGVSDSITCVSFGWRGVDTLREMFSKIATKFPNVKITFWAPPKYVMHTFVPADQEELAEYRFAEIREFVNTYPGIRSS